MTYPLNTGATATAVSSYLCVTLNGVKMKIPLHL